MHGLLHDDQYTDRRGEESDSPVTDLRVVHVAVDDAVSDVPPIIHHAVLDRIEGNEAYRPKALATLERYRVMEADGSITARSAG